METLTLFKIWKICKLMMISTSVETVVACMVLQNATEVQNVLSSMKQLACL